MPWPKNVITQKCTAVQLHSCNPRSYFLVNYVFPLVWIAVNCLIWRKSNESSRGVADLPWLKLPNDIFLNFLYKPQSTFQFIIILQCRLWNKQYKKYQYTFWIHSTQYYSGQFCPSPGWLTFFQIPIKSEVFIQTLHKLQDRHSMSFSFDLNNTNIKTVFRANLPHPRDDSLRFTHRDDYG